MAAPTLPIQNRKSVQVVSPRESIPIAATPPAQARTGSLPSKRNAASHKGRSWADCTPTPWLDYTPTPWSTREPLGSFAPGPFGGQHPSSLYTAPAASYDVEAVWPETPTPSAAAAMAYGFGFNADRPDLLPPPMVQGLPMQPPPRLAEMAAAAEMAAQAAGAAAAAAAAAVGTVDVGDTPQVDGRTEYSRAYGQGGGGSAASQHHRGSSEDSPPSNPSSCTTTGSMKHTVKNTFVHVEEDLDEDDDHEHVALPKSKTMPNVWRNMLASPSSSGSKSVSPPPDTVPAQWDAEEVRSGIPSRGSAMHGTGKCRPCAWFWKPQKCTNLQECGYCHLCPQGELKSRKKSKVAAMRMGALVPAKPGNAAQNARVLKLSPLL